MIFVQFYYMNVAHMFKNFNIFNRLRLKIATLTETAWSVKLRNKEDMQRWLTEINYRRPPHTHPGPSTQFLIVDFGMKILQP